MINILVVPILQLKYKCYALLLTMLIISVKFHENLTKPIGL